MDGKVDDYYIIRCWYFTVNFHYNFNRELSS